MMMQSHESRFHLMSKVMFGFFTADSMNFNIYIDERLYVNNK